ncbi:response regulator transcription factor [Burkholderia cenocepacia]|uniref:response regulator transcription factor n=1 Tax=Burkholderia cenocepacia TaxID=95486 RepID=UPI00264A7C4E|nr:response regulator transcription factor [Burkholderia cenocepacia]MDN7452294.1 response regulator transcription factor [Burkholderia cenocepacia]
MHPDTLIRILIADDHPSILAGIRMALQSIGKVKIVGEAADSSGIVDGLSQHACDVLITDFDMPGGRYNDGFSMLTHIRSHYPDLPIIVFTGLSGNNLTDNLIELGVKAVVSKGDDMRYLTTAILAVHAGATYLSPKVRMLRNEASRGRKHRGLTKSELEVLRLYISGLSVGEIAERLNRTKQTISVQKFKAMQKLGAERDAELYQIIYAFQRPLPDIY